MINIKCEKGAALVFTIFSLMVVAGVVFSFLNLVTTEYKITSTEEKGTQAFYFAEAGIEKALLELHKGENTTFETSINDIEGGSISITSRSLPNSDKLQIISHGTVLDITKTVTVVAARSFFSYALLAFEENKNLVSTVGKNCTVTGDTVVNHNLEIYNFCKFFGEVHYKTSLREIKEEETETFEIIYSKKPHKSTEELAKIYTIDDLYDSEIFNSQKNPHIKKYFGDLIGSNFFKDSDYRVFVIDGNLFIDDTFILEGLEIYVSGFVEIRDNANLENVKVVSGKKLWIGEDVELKNCEIISKDSVHIGKNTSLGTLKKGNLIASEKDLFLDTSSFYGVLFCNGTLFLERDSQITGSIAAKNFFVGENCSLFYDKDVVNRTVGLGKYEIVKWAEK